MKKLNKIQQAKVEVAKEVITKLQDVTSLIYDRLIEDVRNGEDCDWLFDYIFNCSEDSEYTKTVQNQIFE